MVHTLEITVLEGYLGNWRLEKSHFDPCVDGMYFNFGLKLSRIKIKSESVVTLQIFLFLTVAGLNT